MNIKEGKNKHVINFELFDNNITKESAYILGLIWADGHIREKSKSTMLNMVTNDINDVIDVFKTTGDWIVSNEFKKFFNEKEVKSQRKISTSSWGLFNVLKKYNYLEKSKLSPNIINDIPNHLKKYWFRGYLDGDGCIKFKNNKYVGVVFASTYEQDWSFLINQCNELNIKYIIDKEIVSKGKYSHFIIYKKYDVYKFCTYIYDDYDNIGLKRKFNKFIEIKNSIENKEKLGWSKEKILWLKENYHLFGCKYCANYLNMSLQSIYNKIRYLKTK